MFLFRCRDDFEELVYELERRHKVLESIRWDFRALDRQDVGRIGISDALFLFQSVHGARMSQVCYSWVLDN